MWTNSQCENSVHETFSKEEFSKFLNSNFLAVRRNVQSKKAESLQYSQIGRSVTRPFQFGIGFYRRKGRAANCSKYSGMFLTFITAFFTLRVQCFVRLMQTILGTFARIFRLSRKVSTVQICWNWMWSLLNWRRISTSTRFVCLLYK